MVKSFGKLQLPPLKLEAVKKAKARAEDLTNTKVIAIRMTNDP